jgi:hypothetical protein
VSDNSVKQDLLKLLKSTIERRHGCTAEYAESIHVHEMVDSQTIWKGDVEVFDLKSHSEVDKCYAWLHREKGAKGIVINSEHFRIITVLGKRPVDSPAMAVRTAIFYDVQPPSGSRMSE